MSYSRNFTVPFLLHPNSLAFYLQLLTNSKSNDKNGTLLQLYNAGITNLEALEPSEDMLKISKRLGIYRRIIHVRIIWL